MDNYMVIRVYNPAPKFIFTYNCRKFIINY